MLFILGGSDVEMTAIENILKQCDVAYAYASINWQRCHGGNAYKANGWITPDGGYFTSATGTQLYFVECEVQLRADHEPAPIVVDHHRPGDPGFGQEAKDYFNASSVGQVIACLQGFGLYEDNGVEVVPLTYIAAADHCLAAAYANKCRGVDPNTLLKLRAKEKAKFKNCSVEQILANIAEAKDVLFEKGSVFCGGCEQLTWGGEFCQCGDSRSPEIVDLTDHPLIPELPEAACRYGFAYVTTVTEPTGRVKHVLGGCASPEVIQKWMDARKSEGREVYGDPIRGFAGAYVN